MLLQSVHAMQNNGELATTSATVEDKGSHSILDECGPTRSGCLSSIGLASLPQDVLIQIAINIDPWDVVHCQKVSISWADAFSDLYLLQQVLRHNLKDAHEVRSLLEQGRALDDDGIARETGLSLKATFNRLACRYHHLTDARPCSILNLKLMTPKWVGNQGKGAGFPTFYPIGSWDFHRSRERDHLPGMTRRTFDQAFWSYDSGLIVYPSEEAQKLVILDLESEQSTEVPFSLDGRIIRNFRLKSGILVIEWAESSPFHALNEAVLVHRHFVTLFRISQPSSTPCSITFHSEFRLHFLGLPLMDHDRFFSTHTSTHYAVYFWQPNRSMYTGDEEEPIESLLVWNITSPSTYLPSLDPSGFSQPNQTRGPKSIARLSFRDLEFYNVRQRSIPALMSLSIDSETGTLRVRENRKFYTPGYFDPAERCWKTCTTLIPFLGYGPHQHMVVDDDDGSNLPPYVGNCSMESDEDLWGDEERGQAWCENWVNVVDRAARVWFTLAQTMFRGQDAMNWTVVRVKALGREAGMEERWARLVTGKGKLAGDERWLIGEADGSINVLRFDR